MSEKATILAVDDDPVVTEYLEAKLGTSYKMVTTNIPSRALSLAKGLGRPGSRFKSKETHENLLAPRRSTLVPDVGDVIRVRAASDIRRCAGAPPIDRGVRWRRRTRRQHNHARTSPGTL